VSRVSSWQPAATSEALDLATLGDDWRAGSSLEGSGREPHALRVDRFDDQFANDEELREACLSTYVHKYDEEEVQAR
jgi:hypothetical protein